MPHLRLPALAARALGYRIAAVLLLAACAVMPVWPWSAEWGMGPCSLPGVLAVYAVLMGFGRLI